MDGCWWSCLSSANSHLFVNESHSAINYERATTECGFELEGSSDAHRSKIGSHLHAISSKIDTPTIKRKS